MDFVAIDFETADFNRWSPCEVGITTVENFEIVDRVSCLIKPPCYPNFDSFNIKIHGITADMVKDSPTFDEVYHSMIKERISGKLVVAHNAAFDIGVLRDTLDEYNIQWPSLQYVCTLTLARRLMRELHNYSLPDVHHYLGLGKLPNHHRAIDDSEAAANVLIKIFKVHQVSSIDDIATFLDYNLGIVSPDSITGFTKKKKNIAIKDRYSLSELASDESTFNEASVFFNKNVSFTGKLTSMLRGEAAQIITRIGGKFVDKLTNSTNILVVGQQDISVVGDSGLSGKQKKVADLKKKGIDIEVMSEQDFLQNI